MPDVPMPGVGGGMLSVPYDIGGVPMRDAAMGQPMPIQALATALANAATPEHQRTVGSDLGCIFYFILFYFLVLVQFVCWYAKIL
jgi:hypothetical protein